MTGFHALERPAGREAEHGGAVGPPRIVQGGVAYPKLCAARPYDFGHSPNTCQLAIRGSQVETTQPTRDVAIAPPAAWV
jgi:hypothetical protein